MPFKLIRSHLHLSLSIYDGWHRITSNKNLSIRLRKLETVYNTILTTMVMVSYQRLIIGKQVGVTLL